MTHVSAVRDLMIARVQGTAEAYAGRFRPLTRDEALAELHGLTADPDLLAEAAARYVDPNISRPWSPVAVQLLVDAGADPVALERYVADRRAHRARFDLGYLGEQAAEDAPG